MLPHPDWLDEAKSLYRCRGCGQVLGEVARPGDSRYPVSRAKRLVVRREGEQMAILIGFGIVPCPECGENNEWLPGGRLPKLAGGQDGK